MGMFDTVICSFPLPGITSSGPVECQCKDLDCALDTYDITSDGRLFHHYREWEATPEEEKPYPHAKDWRAVCGMIREVAGSQRLVRVPHHGDIDLWVCKPEEHAQKEFRVRFTDGVVSGVSLIRDWKLVDFSAHAAAGKGGA